MLSAHLGYWVDGEVNGRGIASAAVAFALASARDSYGLHRVQAGTLVHNAASQKVRPARASRGSATPRPTSRLRAAGRTTYSSSAFWTDAGPEWTSSRWGKNSGNGYGCFCRAVAILLLH
ncbi:GNAT family protein [Arthrobacter sp. ISL-5]|uniref:GNAT family N-acetyltransferase n=1 Tax=Arthrobacter sp. ISL-5 TaxID=2819111 RepID=UPI0027E146DE|nr:GNAT family protein [Arthrobacter sp. ISL-5]